MSTNTSLHSLKTVRLAPAFLAALAALPFSVLALQGQDSPPATPPPAASAPADAPKPVGTTPHEDEAVILSGVEVNDIPADQSVLPTRPSQSLYGFEEKIIETPRSVFQITKTQLSNDVIENFTDFARYSPSVQRGSTSPYSAPRIRGGTADTLRNNIVLFNTVVRPFNTNAWESLDIVAGIPSVVQGNTSRTAGYINYITKKPYFDGTHTELILAAGRLGLSGRTTYPQYSITLDHSTVLIDNELAVRVSLLQSEHNLYWARNNSEADSQDVFAALTWKPTTSFTLDANFTYTRSSGAPPLGINRLSQNLIDNWRYNAAPYRPIFTHNGTAYRTTADNSAFQVGTWAQNAKKVLVFTPSGAPDVAISNAPWSRSSPANLVSWYQTGVQNVKIDGDETIYGSGSDNNADEYIAQAISTYKINDVFSVRNNTVFQYSDNIDHAYDASYSQHVNKLLETRFELLTDKEFKLFGLPIRHQSNSGFSFRYLSNTCDGFAAVGAGAPVAYADATKSGSYDVSDYLGGLPSNYLGQAPATTSDIFAVADTAYGPIVWAPSWKSGGLYRGAAIGENSGIGNRANLGGADRRTNQLKTTNLFTEHKFDIGNNVTWRAGARLSYVNDSIRTNAITRELVSKGYYSGLNTHDSTTAWDGDFNTSLAYRPFSWLTAYVAFDFNKANQDCGCCQTQGFTGALNTLSDSYFDVESKLYEVGAKFEIIQNTLFANVAWFHQTREVPVANIFTGTQSSNRLIYQGVELSAAWQPSANLSVGGNYSYIDASYRKSGGRYPGSPLNSFNIWASWQFTNGFGVKANLWVASSWNANDAGTLKIPAQYGVDLGLFFAGKKWRLDVDILNLTDEKNWSAAGGLGGNAYTYLLPSERLGVRAKFTYKF
jgi:outer membrane receptor protein involved in Fe transport